MDLSQLLLYGVLVGGFLLFNYVLRRAGERARQQEQQPAQQQDASRSPEDQPIDIGWGRKTPLELRAAAPSVEEASRPTETRAAEPARTVRRRSPIALFRSRHDLRRAIVVMTVLGPCRAFEPHDRR